MSDMSNEVAIRLLQSARDKAESAGLCEAIDRGIKALEQEPKPIDYHDCSNAMLKMWMDNVVTDGEYNRIMDKLNAKHIKGDI